MRRRLPAWRSTNVLRIALVAGLLYGCRGESTHEPPRPRPVSGTLTISGFAGGTQAVDPRVAKHTSQLVPGAGYHGMQDNDIRGLPNGGWVHGWNQVGQRHVRLGRGPYTARFGEGEIVRALQRWDDLPLPANAVVTQASLELTVEEGIDDPADVMLYEVHRDWNPGHGGTLRDNTSPPAPGEVWWLEAAHGEEEWGLPGASFASSDATVGDIAPMALATTQYLPGASKLVFSSPRLAEYLQRRIAASEPLLFLLKLSDSDEDLTGDQLVVYSAEEGDSYARGRRPKLSVEWHAPGEVVGWSGEVLLENGRSHELPKLPAKGADWWAVSFVAHPDFESPKVEVRGGRSESTSEWRPAQAAFPGDWDWAQVRLVAAMNPVTLGTAFESELLDTWVPDVKPEDQTVKWHFTDPLGKQTTLDGPYAESFKWRVAFQPTVPGRWSYYLDHELNWPPYRGERVFFDVIGDDPAVVLAHLDALAARIEASGLGSKGARYEAFGAEFLRLERAGIQLLTPDALRSDEGRQLSSRIDEVRRQLGEALPDRPIPFDRDTRRSIKLRIKRVLYDLLEEPADE